MRIERLKSHRTSHKYTNTRARAHTHTHLHVYVHTRTLKMLTIIGLGRNHFLDR